MKRLLWLLLTACCWAQFDAIPLNDLGAEAYLGQFQGGLYEGGSNFVPSDQEVRALDASTQIGTHGKFIFLGLGMSVSSGEFSTFVQFAKTDAAVNHATMTMLIGARGSAVACAWTYAMGVPPSSCYFGSVNLYDYVRDQVLKLAGFSESQVEVVWIEVTNAHPMMPWNCGHCVGYSLPASNADVYTLEGYLGDIARAIRQRYPRVQQVFFGTRVYGGYSTTNLSPEPFAFENGFAAKWLIQAQINQARTGKVDPVAGYLTSSPVLLWGAYNWASDVTRSDGLVWERSDFGPDGVHFSQPPTTRPSTITGVNKVGISDLDYFKSAPETVWFRAR